MLLGSFHGYSIYALWAIVIIPALPVIPGLIKSAVNTRSGISDWLITYNTTGDRFLFLVVGILGLLYLTIGGNAAVAWDAAVHHYAFPKALLFAGGLIDVPEIPFSFYPSLGEMLFTLGLGIGGEFLAGSMTWIYLFPLAGAFLSIGGNLGNKRIGLWALVLFLGAPLTFQTPSAGVIDLPFFTYCTLALAVLLDARDSLSWRRIILIGLLIGCACATKHLGLLFLPAIIPILIWKMIGTKNGTGRIIGAGAVVALYALLVPLPWYIRSDTATGDPLYPFLTNIFAVSGGQEGAFSAQNFARTDYPRSLIGFILYLWHLTMNYWDLRPWYLAIHPAWLALLPPTVIWAFKPMHAERQRSEISHLRMILILAFLVLSINFFLAPAFPRYIFPVWICLSLTSAWCLVEIRRTWPSIGKPMVPVVLGLMFLVVFGMVAKRTLEVLPQFISEQARHNAVSQAFPGYETFAWANENLDTDASHILSIDPKIYYLDSRAIIAKPGYESSLLVPWDSEPSEILANWRQLGVTHFILDTTLISVKHGYGIALFSSILGDRDAVWFDIVTTRRAAEEFGIGDILTDDEFLYMGQLGQLVIIDDGVQSGRHLFTRENAEMFHSWGRDYRMAYTLLKFEIAGILTEEFRSGPGGGLRLYSVNLPPPDDIDLPNLPDITEWCLPYEDGPVDQL